MQDRDREIERWLSKAVAPVYDAMQANPGRGIPAEDVFASLRAHHAEQMKRTGAEL